jgi:hypothetical protein
MNKDETAIIKLLLYYDIFDHPLTAEEIIINCNIIGESGHRSSILDEMTEKGLIYRLDGYFLVRNDPSLIDKRKNGSRLSAEFLPKARKMAKFISSFPFVLSVSLSGSLSKDYMDKDKDVDYFIIVRPERLWLARTLLVLYKRIFLFNSYKYFCLNYFVDALHLEIEQKNLFTATELFTLYPVTGKEYFQSLMDANLWVKNYFHRFPLNDFSMPEQEKRPFLKRTLEWLLNNGFGNALDKMAMNLTIRFWKKKYRNDRKDLFNRSFRLKRHVAKYHPENFQDLILENFRNKVRAFEEQNRISLN